ncbi:MAG TPA: biotin transporter BioY [Anaerolineaceae bacterium]|nr:biotin transporter BioY [Anaerolineaceae bacterium]HPN52233.1 biotin transporter BioY [Anaerolineaceae bacterium]
MIHSESSSSIIVNAIWPKTSLVRDVALVGMGSLTLAALAQVQIPLLPVPVTGQTLGVLLVGALLGRRLGALSIIAYLFEGLMGLPVFAGASGGLAHLFGPTGGYLLGFVAAAALVGWLSEQGWDRTPWMTALAMVLGNLVIYAAGLSWLAVFTGWEKAFVVGMLPFLAGDALKIGLAAVLLPGGWSLLNRGK